MGVALGFRRLSIIDVDGAQQPLANEDHSVQVVFNGEIYNYRALRDGLAARGYGFRSHSDTEVLLALYAEQGEAMLRRIEGDWGTAFDIEQRIPTMANNRRFCDWWARFMRAGASPSVRVLGTRSLAHPSRQLCHVRFCK